MQTANVKGKPKFNRTNTDLRNGRGNVGTNENMTKVNETNQNLWVAEDGAIYKPLRTMQIPANKINTTRYQRVVSNNRVTEIINDYRLEQVNVLKVALRSDGVFYLIDGQHTYASITAKFKDPELKFTCCVVDCTSSDWDKLTEEEFEARVFTHQHDHTKKLNAQERFKGGYIGKESREVNIVNLFSSKGYTVQFDGKPLATPKSVACVDKLVDIYDKYGLNILEKTLNVIDMAYDGMPESLQDKFMLGVARFIYTHGDNANYSDKKFALALSKHAPEPKKLIHTAQKSASDSKYLTTKKSVGDCMVEELLKAYNKGKQMSNKILLD